MSGVNELCSDILDVAFSEHLNSSCRLSIIHVYLIVIFQSQLECNLGSGLELGLPLR
jgi:hypothetical protein